MPNHTDKVRQVLKDFPKTDNDSYLYITSTSSTDGMSIESLANGNAESLSAAILALMDKESSIKKVLTWALAAYLKQNPSDLLQFIQLIKE